MKKLFLLIALASSSLALAETKNQCNDSCLATWTKPPANRQKAKERTDYCDCSCGKVAAMASKGKVAGDDEVKSISAECIQKVKGK
jgi:hypothetical protein